MQFRWITASISLMATVASVSAVTLDIQWLGGSGAWNTSSNWTPNSLPGVNTHVKIDPLDALNVTVTIDTAATASDLKIGSGDIVSIANARSLTLDAQSSGASLVLNNSDSSLALNSVGNTTSLVISNGTVTASGTGTIDLSNQSNNRIIGSNSTDIFVNQTTIQGAGQLSANSLIIHNQSTIRALYSTALVFDPSPSADSINSGFLQAGTGGLLQLVNGVIDNTGGHILAETGGQVQLSGITIKAGNLQSTGTGSIKVTGTSTLSHDVTIDTGSTVHLNNAVALNIADTLNLNGNLNLDSVGNTTDVVLTSATTTLDGSGKVTLSNNTNNRFYGSSATNLFINKVTIEGAGQIGANSATVNNQGTISALYSNALTLDPSSGGFTNTGTLNATTGGLLQLGSGTFTNTGGTISAATGSEIELLTGAKIIGGDLSSTGTGFIENRSSTSLDGVTLPAGTDLRLPNATNLTLANTISNAGAISIQSVGNTTDLVIGTPGATLTGGGTIELSNNPNNRIYGAATTNLLTNTDNTIRGAGQLGVNSLTFMNQGTVEANHNGASFTLDPAASAFTNTGTFRAVNGGVLVLTAGSFDNTSGSIQAQTGSTVRLTGSASVTEGTLDLGPSAALQLAGGSFDSGSLTTASGSTITTTASANTLGGSLDLVPGANLTLNNATSLSLLSTGSYTIDGILTIDSVGNQTDLIMSGGDVTLSGSGTLVLDNNAHNRIYGASATNQLILNGLNLEGGGQLGVNSLGITTNAIITANDSTALTINPSSAGVTNTGTLKADGGTLALTNGTYTNTDGFIESASGSTVQFNSSTFTGGTLKGTGSLTTIGANTFNDVSIDTGTTFTTANNTASTFTGTLHNAGIVHLHSLGNLTDLIAGSGGLTLTGGGEIKLFGPNSRLYGTNGTTTLTNTNNTIHGYGQLGANQLLFTNQSNVAADVNAQTLTVDASATITNTGLFKAENGGTLTLHNSTFDNLTGGSIQSVAGSQVFLSGLTLNDGHLTGNGTFRNTASSVYSNPRIDSGTILDVDNNTAATISGTLHNAGQIHLNSLGNLTDLIAGSSGLTLTGGGEIHLYGNGNNRLYGQTSSTIITNTDNTIRGYGQIGVNQSQFINQGTVIADTGGQTLKIDTSNGLTNSGLLHATNNADLLLNDSTITNLSGGSIQSDTGSTVRFASVTLNDGLLTGGGTFRNSLGSSIYHHLNITSGTVLDIDNNTSATFSGTLNNAGRIDLNSLGNLTNFIADSSGLTLAGNGSVQISGHSNNRLYGQDATTTLTHNSGHTIRGSGQLGVNQLLLENFGTIEADAPSPLTIDLSSTFTNQGNLKATGTGGITISDPLVNQGGDIKIAAGSNLTVSSNTFIQSAGTTEINGGTFSASSLQIDGGDFDGHGTVNGPTAATAAFISPEPGTLTFSSSLTLNSDTTVQIELAGSSPSTGYGNLSAQSLVLGGTLHVRFATNFENNILNTDVFTLLSASSTQTGTFSNAIAGTRFFTTDGLGSFDVTYHSLSVTLSNFQPIPEPATWTLLVTGIALIGVTRRRRSSGR